ncbi:hypothetical protein [Flavobacterium crocinum]|nr:hypothetical protein [Flavobacterium crocinum]
MREFFKRNNIFFFLFILLFLFSNRMSAQNSETDGGFDWDGMNELDNLDLWADNGGYDDSWDHASLYWDTEPNDYGSNYDDYYEPYDWRDNNNNHNDQDTRRDQEPAKEPESKIVLTKTVLPGETHVQEVKVIRDPETSAEKKVIDLTVNGEKVGTITFSDPIIDVNGVDIYSKMTIEVFPECPIAITTITFDSPETSRYDDTKDSINGNLENAIVNLSLYKDYGIIDFTSPINEKENIVITGSTDAVPNYLKIKKDPCAVAKELNVIGANPVFKKAVQDIRDTPDFYKKEYSIPLGINNSSQIYAGEINSTGTLTGVEVKHYSVQNFFLDLHNHPSLFSHSPGDIYNRIVLSKMYPNYNGGIVLTDTEVYAAVVTDLAAAQNFASKYIIISTSDNKISYTESVQEEISSAWSKMDTYLTEGQTKAKQIVLSKYNAGITFFKQNNEGTFYPLITKQTKQPNGRVTYSLIPCI